MTEAKFRVDATASFVLALDRIEAFLREADADPAFEVLLSDLDQVIVPNLRRFPTIGRRYLDRPPASSEALAQLASLPRGVPGALREYLHDEYLILFFLDVRGSTVYLLSIRHHRELCFDLLRFWPG